MKGSLHPVESEPGVACRDRLISSTVVIAQPRSTKVTVVAAAISVTLGFFPDLVGAWYIAGRGLVSWHVRTPKSFAMLAYPKFVRASFEYWMSHRFSVQHSMWKVSAKNPSQDLNTSMLHITQLLSQTAHRNWRDIRSVTVDIFSHSLDNIT